jgi:hypothetical protein
MSVGEKAKIMLRGRSAYRCNHPDCRCRLFVDETQTDDPTLIGEICHIVARQAAGPRGQSALTAEQRDRYANLILLCRNHHKLIDDNPEKYSVEVLHLMKEQHEQWVENSLPDYDSQKQRDDEVYATYVDEWARRVNLDQWTDWTSYLTSSGQPSLYKHHYEPLVEATRWLFGRIWPGRYSELEAAFDNFNSVLSDLLMTFKSRMEERGERLWTEKWYHRAVGMEHHDRLAREFDFHVDLVEDLTLELTRAANYVCDRVRESFDPSFRMEEGLLLAKSGPYEIDDWEFHRVEYRGAERILHPYPGLERFKAERERRDMNFGEGSSIDDPNCKIAGY